MKNSEPLIINISSWEDIQKLEKIASIKYINIDISNPSPDIIEYFLANGQKYSYAETIGTKPGYIYVSYELFAEGQKLINNIINNIPANFTPLEIARYLYVTLGSMVGYDINTDPTKNEDFNFTTINIINNIWSAIATKKVTNSSLTKLYYYLCRQCQIDCHIIPSKDNRGFANQLCLDNSIINVGLMEDLPYIQGKFKTAAFGSYNDNETLDQKVGYIQNDYNNRRLTTILQDIDVQSDEFLEEVLTKTQELLPIQNIKPIELSLIYQEIFDHYFPSNPISINNLYIHDTYNNKEHFILFTYLDKHYSFNYNRNSFVNISNYDLENNINNHKIGVYQNEDMPHVSEYQKSA